MKKIIITTSIFFVIVLIALGICLKYTTSKLEESTIGNIAYDYNETLGYTVYIKENDEYIPYLVLTNEYNDSTLLLRKFLLDESLIYNEVYDYCAYYAESYIDNYLNTTFLNRISENVKEKIIANQIEITKKETLYGSGIDETENIQRKIFLLSYTEAGGEPARTILKEGKALKYFKASEQRKTMKKQDEKTRSWWLRTPNIIHDDVVCGVDYNGIIGIGGLGYTNGVRPAFTIPSNTKITKILNDELNEEIYIIE